MYHDPHGRIGRAMGRAAAEEQADLVNLYRFLFKLPFLLVALPIRLIVFLWRRRRRNRQPTESSTGKGAAN